MPRKGLVLLLCVGPLFAAGCAAPRGNTSPIPAVSPAEARPAPPEPSRHFQRTEARSPAKPTPARPARAPQPAASRLPEMVNGSFAWIESGRSFSASAGKQPSGATPVPLFRQAIVLADVRAALASSPARPVATFRQGTLTLSFSGGSDSEIADAVNRALQTGEVSRVEATIAK